MKTDPVSEMLLEQTLSELFGKPPDPNFSKYSSLVTSCHKSVTFYKTRSSNVKNKNIPGKKMMSAEHIHKNIHVYDTGIKQKWTLGKMT